MSNGLLWIAMLLGCLVLWVAAIKAALVLLAGG
jgi:hypothetical protein